MVDLTPDPRPEPEFKEEPAQPPAKIAPDVVDQVTLKEFFTDKPTSPHDGTDSSPIKKPNGHRGGQESPSESLPGPGIEPPPVPPNYEDLKVAIRNIEKGKHVPEKFQFDLSQSNQAGEVITHLLKEMVHLRASDLHLRSGTAIIYRVDGNLISYGNSIVPPEFVKEVLYHMLSVRHRKIFEAKNEADFSFSVPNVGRFRGNAFRQRGSVAIVLRQIPTQMPTIVDLNLPPVIEKFCRLSRGMVLICGPTGSGKSTTLASMINKVNEERAEHIVTIEDPIEFLHRDKKSIISQRELGTDTISFTEALKHVLRQDPDVILLGEMRDLETTSTAITAAQTGHLVFSTLHTTDAVQTINRIIDLYPPHQQQQVRFQLADTLKGVVCMRLMPHSKGVGRVPACEILVVTALVRKAISDNKMVDVQEAIRQGQYYGMQTFHQALLKLYKDGIVKLDDALEAASNPEELMMAIRGITSGTESAA